MTMPVDHLNRFFSDVRADPVLSTFADQIESALRKANLAADSNAHEAARFAGIEWILAQDRTAMDKVEAIAKLSRQTGFVQIPSLRTFFGWGN